MADAYDRLRDAVRGETLPLALLDFDAVSRNAETLLAPARARRKTIRLATKSLRSPELIRRVMALDPGVFRGLMAYAPAEVSALLDDGFDDVLLAYPTCQVPLLGELSRRAAAGRNVMVMVDDLQHLLALDEACRAGGGVIGVVVDVDMSLRLLRGRVHLGVRRSPVRDADRALALAEAVLGRRSLRFAGFMGYEAQVAGLTDAGGSRVDNALKSTVRALSRRHAAALRGEISARARSRGIEVAVFNGGGSGSIDSSSSDDALSEVTVGSGLLDGHLFDHYSNVSFEPALYFALEVARRPEIGIVTCAGGGYIASGPAGRDRLPLPWLPRGLSLLPYEGAGEVQTPLAQQPGVRLKVGDPVFFRHAKAGELAERFSEYLLLEGDGVSARLPTYRGLGRCYP